MRVLKRRLTSQHIILGVFLVVVSLLTALGVVGYHWYQQILVKPNQLSQNPSVSPQPSPTPPDPLAPFNIALLGYGGVGHAGGSLTDSMMVVHVIPREKRVVLLSLPRDIWVSLPISDPPHQAKINTAYSIGNDDRRYTHKPELYQGEAGGGNLVKYALEQVTGLPVAYFVAVDFSGFKQVVDTLGGVNVKVERTFDDPLYPIAGKEEDTCGKSPEEVAATVATLSAQKAEEAFSCRYELLHFDRGQQTMDGETALKFVRSRHSPQDGGDINRAARQRAVLEAVREKMLSLSSLPKLPGLVATLTKYVRTDIPLTKVQQWLGQAGEFQTYTVTGVALTDKEVLMPSKSGDRQYILIPKAGDGQWQEVHAWVQAQLGQSLPDELQ